jgi:hypothetical protein
MTRAVERAVARAKARVAEALAREEGLSVEEVPGGIAVSGRRLKARWLTDPRLRWLGGWL